MVVYTQTERVKTAQRSVVEFLLINHPLDCPVCDKGGECPLQDITFGWGAGISRFVEPKRHFVKPLELSPLVAIDRERCILCYRCVRFSQEVAEDYQLVLLERGAHSYVATFDGHPYVAPVRRQHRRAVPGGGADLAPVPLPRAAVGHRGRRLGVHAVPLPVQRHADRPRRARAARARRARTPRWTTAGCATRAASPTSPSTSTSASRARWCATAGSCGRSPWERALEQAAATLKRSGAATAALAGSGTTNEEGLLLSRLMREGLGSPHLDSRRAGALPLELHRALGDPALQASTSDLEFAHVALVLDLEPVDDAPILDLRLRKGARRRGLQIAVASPKASTLEQSAALIVRYELGQGAAFAAALAAALRDEPRGARAGAGGRAARRPSCERLARLLRGEDGERAAARWCCCGASASPPGRAEPPGARALLAIAEALGMAATPGAGLLEVPLASNGRGLREAGVLPNAGPGLSEPARRRAERPDTTRPRSRRRSPPAS